jgi:hypothetical protein
MSGQPTRAMRVMLGSEDSLAARAVETWLACARGAEPPAVDVVCVARRPISHLGRGPEPSPVARRRALADVRRVELGRAQAPADDAPVSVLLGPAALAPVVPSTPPDR